MSRALTLPSRGRPQAGFAHLRPPLMSNVRRLEPAMNLLRLAVTCLLLVVGITGCDFQQQADAKFGDQHFKTAIALIELHKVRNGQYPESLKALQFTGDWDAIAISAVEYKKHGSGYGLNVTRGWVTQPTLTYPQEFWKGLGLTRS